MKKSLISLLSISILTLTFGNLALAGNGGGANGPDLQGDAIPLETDREISTAILRQRINACEEHFLFDLYSQAFGRKDRNDFRVIRNQSWSSTRYDLAGKFYGNIIGFGPFIDDKPEKGLALLVSSASQHSVLLSEGQRTIRLPRLKFTAKFVDMTYDNWGNIISDNYVATEILLLNEPNGPLKMVNARTGVQIDFELDLRPLSDCLKRIVQE